MCLYSPSDKCKDTAECKDPTENKRKFQEIQDAYTVLRDPNMRAEYDRNERI